MEGLYSVVVMFGSPQKRSVGHRWLGGHVDKHFKVEGPGLPLGSGSRRMTSESF